MISADDKKLLVGMEKKLGVPSTEDDNIETRTIRVLDCLVHNYTYFTTPEAMEQARREHHGD